MIKFLAFGAAAAVLAGCAAAPVPVPPPTVPPPPPCPVTQSSNWKAWVDAMPGPGTSGPTLNVTGTITLPSGAWQPAFAKVHVLESYPVQVVVELDATPGETGGPTAVTREIRGSWPSQPNVGSVTVMCRGTQLTRVAPVQTGY